MRLSRAALLYQQRPETLPIASALHSMCSSVEFGNPAADG
jgi:hypothetical protein